MTKPPFNSSPTVRSVWRALQNTFQLSTFKLQKHRHKIFFFLIGVLFTLLVSRAFWFSASSNGLELVPQDSCAVSKHESVLMMHLGPPFLDDSFTKSFLYKISSVNGFDNPPPDFVHLVVRGHYPADLAQKVKHRFPNTIFSLYSFHSFDDSVEKHFKQILDEDRFDAAPYDSILFNFADFTERSSFSTEQWQSILELIAQKSNQQLHDNKVSVFLPSNGQYSKDFRAAWRRAQQWGFLTEQSHTQHFFDKHPDYTGKFTLFPIVIMGYNVERAKSNHHTLFAMYGEHPAVAKIVILWNNVDKAYPISLREVSKAVPSHLRHKIQIRLSTENSLNNRFEPTHDVSQYPHVVTADDDREYPPLALSCIWNIAKKHPRKLVGKFGRQIKEPLRYSFKDKRGENRLVLTGLLFAPVDFLHAYWSSKFKHLRRAVNDLMDGEDILMNFIGLSKNNGESGAVTVPMKVVQMTQQGAITKTKDYPGGRLAKRSHVIKVMGAEFGYTHASQIPHIPYETCLSYR